MSPTPVWFITAASSGFGHEIALQALQRGHTVVATARKTSSIQDLADAGAHALAFDVTSPLSSIETTAAEVFSKHGRVDYLINAAGYILDGAVEEITPQEVYDSLNTNVFGILNTAKAFIPGMRTQELNAEGNRGTIVTFGSLGSWNGGASFSIYAMTKSCASSLAESLAIELAPFKIRATVVEPGYFRTGFLKAGAKVMSKARLEPYEDPSTPTGQTRQALVGVNGNQPGDVEKGCKVMVDILTGTGVGEGKTLPVRIPLGKDCDAAIRKKCTDSIAILDEWKDAIHSTDHDDVA